MNTATAAAEGYGWVGRPAVMYGPARRKRTAAAVALARMGAGQQARLRATSALAQQHAADLLGSRLWGGAGRQERRRSEQARMQGRLGAVARQRQQAPGKSASPSINSLVGGNKLAGLPCSPWQP